MRRTLVPPIDTPPLPPALGSAVHALHGQTMGTTWSVKLVAHAGRDLPSLQRAIQGELDLVVAQMSTWEPDSDLSRFNRAPAGSRHPLPVEFFTVLDCALQVAHDSGGAVDPTAGALVNAWGFGPMQRYNEAGFVMPGDAQLQAARAQCGWQRIELDPVSHCALQPGGVVLDLSAIAKGFGVDLVARRLRQRGIDSFLVEVGGELRGEGTRPDGQPWWVELERPLPDAAAPCVEIESRVEAEMQNGIQSDIQTIVALHGWSIATSGDYRRYFESGAQRYSHTIDPRDGLPVQNGLASVTVLHRDCMHADAWSTALGVLGAEEGAMLADRLGLCALFITRREGRFKETLSTPLQQWMEGDAA